MPASTAGPKDEIQRLVDSHFQASSSFWTQVYAGDDVLSLICQRRRDIALEWVDRLRLPLDSAVLDVGCGSGLVAVELARRGFIVDATDTVTEMIELARNHAERAHVGGRVRVALSDVHAMQFDSQTFDVVIALGVIPWLHSPEAALREIGRVLKPAGHVIVTANNADRLTHLLDPRYNRQLSPLRVIVKRLLRGSQPRKTPDGAPAQLHTAREFDTLLAREGLQKVEGRTVGFGPFTFWGRELLSSPSQVKLHRWLQRGAERGLPGIRSLGTQYLVLARKPAS